MELPLLQRLQFEALECAHSYCNRHDLPMDNIPIEDAMRASQSGKVVGYLPVRRVL